MKQDTLISFFLRLGISIPFLYAAISAWLQPESWVGFLPNWITSLIPATLLLTGFSLYQLGLSLWLLWGKHLRYSAILAAVTLLGIIIANLTVLDIVFRDVGLFWAAVALAIMGASR